MPQSACISSLKPHRTHPNQSDTLRLSLEVFEPFRRV